MTQNIASRIALEQPSATANSGPPKVSIERLMAVVRQGGTVRTGIDIVSKQGKLLLEKDVPVSDIETLERVKRLGIDSVPIVPAAQGGIWDAKGEPLELPSAPAPTDVGGGRPMSEIDQQLQQITEIKEVATAKYEKAKDCIKLVLDSIQQNNGEFDASPVADTVGDLVDFVSRNENSFSYMTREIFSYDDYLYNHSINVCTIGTVVMKKFNENFSGAVNAFLNNTPANAFEEGPHHEHAFSYFQPEELRDISIGFFMHDLGKVLIDPKILNKNGKLSESEFKEIKTHTAEKAMTVLEKNCLGNPYITNVCLYHHAPLYRDEPRCYPELNHTAIPPYVKVCKLADIYDAMTSKRAYKEALNPVGVVTEIFNRYAKKDPLLQYILHSFVNSVGIYPPGSVVALTDGRQCYVMDSKGPVLLPITDFQGKTLSRKQDPIKMVKGTAEPDLKIDRRRPPLSPLAAYKILPDYLRRIVNPPGSH
ncbi:HD-GYP domain-containing protein [Desulfurivibrio dismutans]|uniref:HD-GYP domain-containing protein n=1 Tax=Desulfurivibrio dismutans TaxID=1398908 RepID=UPI0023DBB9E1|nr:HD domain-containing protein [Desulfurivibrio alkaliphilus]MDF1613966.1 HD domain-containing protein [Desulfurivibrio alkaliphilus]